MVDKDTNITVDLDCTEFPIEGRAMELILNLKTEADEAGRKAMMAAIMPFANQIDGIKKLIVAQHGIKEGQWNLSPDMTKMIRIDSSQDLGK